MSTEQNLEIAASETPSSDPAPAPASTRALIEEAAKELAVKADTLEAVQKDIGRFGDIDPSDTPEAAKSKADSYKKQAEQRKDLQEQQGNLQKQEITETKPIQPEGATAPEPDGRPQIPAPKFLKPERRAAFEKLPYEAKELVASIEHETRRWGSQIAQEVAEARKFQRDLDTVLTPHQNLLKLNKVEPIQAVDHLLTNAAMLDAQPAPMIARFMRQYGLTPEQIAATYYGDGSGYPGQSGNGHYQPPQEEYYDPRAEDALKRVESLEERYKQESEGREQQKQQALLGEIESFRGETDKSGQPLRPHFDRFRSDIGKVVDQLESEKPWLTPPQLLNEAYTKVVSDFEETFVKPRLTNGQFAPKDKAQVEKSKRAEAAAGSLSGSSLGNSAKRTYSSTSDAMRESARELGMEVP